MLDRHYAGKFAEMKSTLAAINDNIAYLAMEDTGSSFRKTIKKARKLFDTNKE